MIARHMKSCRFMTPLRFLVFMILLMGCGAVGPPIPPENVGIEAKVRKQQQDKAKKEGTVSEDSAASLEEETVELPTFYPIGTR